jgi:hypothetical protein
LRLSHSFSNSFAQFWIIFPSIALIQSLQLIQVFLPGETSAHKWTAALWPLIRKFDPKTVFHTDKSASYIGFFPGESDEGGGGCIIYFEMKFTTRVDSCEVEY